MTEQAKYAELIERLELLREPDRETDCAIALALGWTFQKMKGDSKPYYRRPGVTDYYRRSEPPNYTGSIDAAMPGEKIVGMVEIAGRWIVTAEAKDGSQYEGRSSANEAIARRIAALRAKSGGNGNG